MTKLIKEFELQTQITEAMMERWGYSKRQALTNTKKNVAISGFDVLDPHSLPKLNQTLPESERPRFYGGHKDYLKMAEGLFKQFNYVVGYKPRQGKKQIIEIREPQPKSTLEVIQDNIQNTKKQIVAKSSQPDFQQHYHMNNKLNKLFKKFYKVSKQKTKSFSAQQKTRLSTKNSLAFREQLRFKPPKINYQFVKQRKRAQSLLQPFEVSCQNSFLESSKIQTKIMHEKQVLELYKSKVDEIRKNSVDAYQSLREISPPKRQPIQKIASDTQQSFGIYQMRMTGPRNNIDYQQIAAQKQKKQEIFTKILRNRNSKYIRSKGTSFLVKYNQEEEAKQLLAGKAKPCSREEDAAKDCSQRGVDYDYDIAVMSGPPQRVPDTRDYEAQFRNQKIQASMRLRKKHST